MTLLTPQGHARNDRFGRASAICTRTPSPRDDQTSARQPATRSHIGKLGGDGETVAHVVNNSAAWDDAGNGFTEIINKGAIVINRTTAYANGNYGYYFATSAAKLGKNLAVSNGSGSVSKGSSVTSAGNNWDSGISSPSFISANATTCYNARSSSGTLPATTFLTTGSSTIGATMNLTRPSRLAASTTASCRPASR